MATNIFLGKPPKYIEDWYKNCTTIKFNAVQGMYEIPIGYANLSTGTYSIKYIGNDDNALNAFSEIRSIAVS